MESKNQYKMSNSVNTKQNNSSVNGLNAGEVLIYNTAIKKYINGLNKVSNERIFDEVKKILKLKKLNNLFSTTSSKEIILSIFPQFQYYERINTINNLAEKIQSKLHVKSIWNSLQSYFYFQVIVK